MERNLTKTCDKAAKNSDIMHEILWWGTCRSIWRMVPRVWRRDRPAI
jgi:hypothetical protein